MCTQSWKKFSGWVKDNSFTESENAALKGDPSGPKANNVLHISTDANVTHTNKRFIKLQTTAHQDVVTTTLASGSVTQLRQRLSETVKDFIANDMESQWNARKFLEVHHSKLCMSNSIFLISFHRLY